MTNVQPIIEHTTTDNFSFLQHWYPELYRLGMDMDRFYSQDHSCALLKARLFAEVWCHVFAEKVGVELDCNTELTNKIKQLQSVANVPPYIIDELEVIRLNANLGVHAYCSITNEWIGRAQTSQKQVNNTMQAVLELASFLVFNICGEKGEKTSWQAPTHIDEIKNVELALNGNKEANYALAKQALSQLEHYKNKELVEDLTRNQVKTLKRDLEYWLSRSALCNAEGTALLYAKAYQLKWLQPSEHHNAETCYKAAIKECESGEAHYEFALYINKKGQNNRAWQHAEKAAELGHFEAITDLQVRFKTKDTLQFNYWLEKGIAHKEPNSFTVDAGLKIKAWLLNQEDELAQKRARSALIEAKARRAKGIDCLQAYCDYFGYWNKTPEKEKALATLAENYSQLPSWLNFNKELFEVFKTYESKRKLAIKIGNQVVAKTQCNVENAQYKFDLGMLIWQELLACGKAKSPYALKALIREAASEGCENAAEFLALPKGKQLMRDNSFVTTRSQFKQPDRKKQKQAKKKARKAKKK